MRKVIALLDLVFLLALSSPANATLMAIWDFGPDAPRYTLDPTAYNVSVQPSLAAGNADYDDNGKDGTAYTDAAGILHVAGQAVGWDDVSGAGADDAYLTITINTTGWQDMWIRWDYFSDNTGGNKGPVSFDFAYKVGAGSWVTLLNNQAIVRDDAWHEFRYDMSAIAAIENQASVEFRIDDLDNNDDDGNFKLDNLEVTGVPEPCTIALLGLGGLALLRRRRA